MPKDSIVTGATLSNRKAEDFELVTADFGEDVNKEIENWLHESIRVSKESFDVLFKQKVPEWRRISEGKPKDKTKSFPWPNCSNLVVQVAGQRIDDICARVIGLIWATSPIAYCRYFVKSQDPHREAEKARILEQFLDICAYEPDELDLYRIENVGFSDSARLGTHFFKVIPEKRTQVTATRVGNGMKLDQTETYNGPKVENLEFEDVLFDPQAPTWDKSRYKIHIRRVSRHELRERAFRGFYDKDKVQDILNKPDRHGPDFAKMREEVKKGKTQPQAEILAEWDIYEAYFWWFLNVKGEDGKRETVKVDLTWSYHYSSRTVLRQVFNFIPSNACSMIPTKLDISSKGVHGSGFAEMLANAQEEVSTQHNQRIDARTMAITGILRSSNPNLDKNILVYPFCIIPAQKDELELLKAGVDIGDGGIQDEQLTLQLADERAGVGPAVAGMGTGQIDKKGRYGSMGTLAVMQDSNTRVNLRISDFRHSHVRLLTLCTQMYGKFGTGSSGELFGLDEKILHEALQDFLGKKVRIPLRAATASANKEVEKQNAMLLKTNLSMHYQEQAKLMQALKDPNVPPEGRKYFTDVIKSQDAMMMHILRDFGFDQPREYVPEIELGEQNGKAQPGQPNPSQVQRMAQPGAAPGNGAGAGGFGGMEALPQGPQGPAPS